MNYDPARAHLKRLGLTPQEPWIAKADAIFGANGIAEPVANSLIMLQGDLMATAFNPRSYNLKTRLALAVHFLFGGPLRPI